MMGARYAKPRDIATASSLLANLGPGASIIAGGQELMPTLNCRVFAPTVLVDINGLKELKGIKQDNDYLSVGALCVHREIENDALVRENAPLLAHAVSCIGGGWQVRNRGTIGGNIVSMHPLYDVMPALLVMKASVAIVREGEERVLSLAEVLTSTAHGLGTEAILTRVLIPIAPINVNWGYYKLKNTHGAYASATAAALVKLDHNQRLADIRVAIGSVEALPRDISAALGDLNGIPIDDNVLRRIEALARQSILEPISDQRGDGEYRAAMGGVSARRSVEMAAAWPRAFHITNLEEL